MTSFQECIGVLLCAIFIVRVHILTELSFLSSHQDLPPKGYLLQVIHIFGYLKRNPKGAFYFDPSLAKIDPSMFKGDEPLVLCEQYLDSKK